MLFRRQRWIVGALCIAAVLRVLIFSMGFPLFNQVDEQDHYDMIHRYAHGYSPTHDLPGSDPVMADTFALYGSPEYLFPSSVLASTKMDSPPLAMSAERRSKIYERVFRYWTTEKNIEAQSPPVYYAVAGAWHKLGELLGLVNWRLAYWTRGLGATLYGIFVYIAYLFTKTLFPAQNFTPIAVPALLAVFPQDVFFGMNRDILSPLLAALVLLLLVSALQRGSGWQIEMIAASLLASVAFLTDVSNFVMFGAVAFIGYVIFRSEVGKRNGKSALAIMAAAMVAGSTPALLWMGRNLLVMGDITGSKAKTAYLGWTLMPRTEVWNHPIFSLQGLSYFLKTLTESYWRGEFLWGGVPMHSPIGDAIYICLTVVMVGACAASLRRENSDETARIFKVLSVGLLFASVLFLAFISLLYDFHGCFYPSRTLPYFVSGRIVIGTLLPFALILALGFEYAWRPLRRYVHPILPLACLCIYLLSEQVVLRGVVFHSRFNFFALARM